MKQNKYPVMFLTQGITARYADYFDPRTHNIPIGVYFALAIGILVSGPDLIGLALLALAKLVPAGIVRSLRGSAARPDSSGARPGPRAHSVLLGRGQQRPGHDSVLEKFGPQRHHLRQDRRAQRQRDEGVDIPRRSAPRAAGTLENRLFYIGQLIIRRLLLFRPSCSVREFDFFALFH